MKSLYFLMVVILILPLAIDETSYGISTPQILFMKSNSVGHLYIKFSTTLHNQTRILSPIHVSDANQSESSRFDLSDLSVIPNRTSITLDDHETVVDYTITTKNNLKGIFSFYLPDCGRLPFVVGLDASQINPITVIEMSTVHGCEVYPPPIKAKLVGTNSIEQIDYGKQSSTNSSLSNTTQILGLSNEQYPTDGKTGDVITINGTITNLIDKDVNVLFILQSDGSPYSDWHMIDSKPYSLFGFENMTVPAGKSIDYQYKIRLLKAGTFFFQPYVQVRGLKDITGKYINFETAGKRGTITVTGQDVNQIPFVRTVPGASNASIAAGGNFTYVIWQARGIGDHDNIFLASSSDNGTNFTSPIDISNTRSDSLEPAMTASNKYTYAIWKDNTDSIGEFSSIRVMGGDVHRPSYGVSRLSTGWAAADSAKMAWSEGNVYSVWIEHWPPRESLYTAGVSNDTSTDVKSRLHGIVYFSWITSDIINSRPRMLSDDLDDSFNPQVAADGYDVFLAWEERGRNGTDYTSSQIYYSYSEDGGITFHTMVASGNDMNSTNPKISTSDGKIYLAYEDSKNDLVIERNTGNRPTFSNIGGVYHGTSHFILRDMISKNNNVYVLWTDVVNDSNSIFLSSSKDHGDSFTNPLVLGQTTEPSSIHLSAASNNLYVTWTGKRNGTDEILFKKISDNGSMIGNTIAMHNDTNPMNPYVSARDNNVFVAWTDASPGIYHAFFRASHDNGTSFGPTIYLEGKAPKIQSNNNALGSIGIIAGLIFMVGVSTIGVIAGSVYLMRRKRVVPEDEQKDDQI